VVGEELWHELNGVAVRPLYTARPPHNRMHLIATRLRRPGFVQ
jgi:hypothetical protein